MFGDMFRKLVRQIDPTLPENRVQKNAKNLAEAPPEKLDNANKPVSLFVGFPWVSLVSVCFSCVSCPKLISNSFREPGFWLD